MHKYKNLEIWKRSVDLATDIYAATEQFPEHENFGLITQLRRCSISIPSNIAEGAGRGSNKDFKRFLNIAYGSIYELETQLLISKKLGYLTDEKYESMEKEITEIQKMIYAFIKKI